MPYHQACLTGTQQPKIDKSDDIGYIENFSVAPIETGEVRKNYSMIILREKRRCGFSRNLLIRAAAYDTMRSRTVLPIHQIKTF